MALAIGLGCAAHKLIGCGGQMERERGKWRREQQLLLSAWSNACWLQLIEAVVGSRGQGRAGERRRSRGRARLQA
jgi:hypothetical protein